MIRCNMALRRLGVEKSNMEEVAGAVTSYLYENLIDSKTGNKACVLVRFYKTHAFSRLESGLQEFVCTLLKEHEPPADMKCLTLLATTGDEASWNDRHQSRRHRAIPLLSEEMVSEFPMIAQLVTQFGLTVTEVVKPEPSLLLDRDERTYNVFHVEQALGSPHIPAQDELVVPRRVRSVLGFGGVLPSGELVATILFSKVLITREIADLFKTISLSMKLAVLPFVGGVTFSEV